MDRILLFRLQISGSNSDYEESEEDETDLEDEDIGLSK